jgi:hypothetical protein
LEAGVSFVVVFPEQISNFFVGVRRPTVGNSDPESWPVGPAGILKAPTIISIHPDSIHMCKHSPDLGFLLV